MVKTGKVSNKFFVFFAILMLLGASLAAFAKDGDGSRSGSSGSSTGSSGHSGTSNSGSSSNSGTSNSGPSANSGRSSDSSNSGSSTDSSGRRRSGDDMSDDRREDRRRDREDNSDDRRESRREDRRRDREDNSDDRREDRREDRRDDFSDDRREDRREDRIARDLADIEVRAFLVGDTTKAKVEINFVSSSRDDDAIALEAFEKIRSLNQEEIQNLLRIRSKPNERLREQFEIEVTDTAGSTIVHEEFKFLVKSASREEIARAIQRRLDSLTLNDVRDMIEFE